ncbi:MAG: hypothetical protein ABEL76_14895 [Bradymonadaceae bacterium]
MFLESYTIVTPGGVEPVDVFLDSGLTYLFTPRMQGDLYIGVQLPDATTLFGGVGFSFLI